MESPVKKKLFVRTYGCQMNVYDSDRMKELVLPLGYQTVNEPDDADMIILNTCHIREKASEKTFSELGRLNQHKKRRQQNNRSTIIAVAGCVAQAEGKEIQKRAPYVDIVLGPQAYHRLPQMIAEIARSVDKSGRMKLLDTDFPAESKFDHLPAPHANQRVSAFLSIQEGCDKFCTFCVVPYTRGAEFSRPVEDVLNEARILVDQGVQEVTLLGQNVNAYHGVSPFYSNEKEWNLAKLIGKLSEINGLERIRYTTSHPRDMDDDLIHAHGEIKKLMPFLHLPVQSGSDRILAAMQRKHTAQDYMDIIDRLKKCRPDIALSSDFIVGFPGESEIDFRQTVDLVEHVGFALAYSFQYSPRPGTPASAMDHAVPADVASERLHRLQSLLLEQQKTFNQSMLGKTFDILIEKTGQHVGQVVGRSPYNQAVVVDVPHDEQVSTMIGSLMTVTVDKILTHSLHATLTTTG